MAAGTEMSSLSGNVELSILQPYYEQITPDTVLVRDVGAGKGKGLFAQKRFKREDEIFCEKPLVAIQHTANRLDSFVCSRCYKFLGSIEQQVARKLVNILVNSTDAEAEADGDGDSDSDDDDDPDRCKLSAPERIRMVREVAGAEGKLLVAALGGALKMPHSDKFPLPSPVQCRGLCAEQYCSAECEAAAWKLHHCLLCPGQYTTPWQQSLERGLQMLGVPPQQSGSTHGLRTQIEAPDQEAVDRPEAAGASSSDRPSLQPHTQDTTTTGTAHTAVSTATAEAATAEAPLPPPPPPATTTTTATAVPAAQGGGEQASSSRARPPHQSPPHQSPAHQCPPDAPPRSLQLSPQHRVTVLQEALQRFLQHADETNDVFRLAAQVVATTLLRAGELLQEVQAEQQKDEVALGAALRQAWLPFAAGWKSPWWETVAVPEDVEDEGEFRGQLRSLAAESLSLLTASWQGIPFTQILDLQVWGSLIGMFELNNLDLRVPSPVEDYFLLIDDLPPADKATAQRITQPLLDALDKDYYSPCQGNAFFALQSCANHSCIPNATPLVEEDGVLRLLALRSISVGEEVCISYIDEEQPLADRQADIADYGFVCKCQRCWEEGRKRSGKGKGVARRR